MSFDEEHRVKRILDDEPDGKSISASDSSANDSSANDSSAEHAGDQDTPNKNGMLNREAAQKSKTQELNFPLHDGDISERVHIENTSLDNTQKTTPISNKPSLNSILPNNKGMGNASPGNASPNNISSGNMLSGVPISSFNIPTTPSNNSPTGNTSTGNTSSDNMLSDTTPSGNAPSSTLNTQENGTPTNTNGGGNEPPDSTHNGTSNEEPFIPPVMQASKEEQESPMGILGHLGELRRRLTRCVIIILLGFVACYGFAEQIYSFLANPLIINLPEGSTLIYTSPQGAFFTYLKVSLMAAILFTTPFSFYQVWAFIAPGLYKEERRAVIPLALLSSLFFLSGATFCYYMVFPVAFEFFMGFTTDMIVPMISVEEYLSFAVKLVLAFGLVFEMPLFSYFLAKLRIITPEKMRKHRKYAILAIFIVAAILTPPDVFSQILMAMPMCVLYEISIYVAKMAQKNSQAPTKNDVPPEDLSDKINNFK